MHRSNYRKKALTAPRNEKNKRRIIRDMQREGIELRKMHAWLLARHPRRLPICQVDFVNGIQGARHAMDMLPTEA